MQLAIKVRLPKSKVEPSFLMESPSRAIAHKLVLASFQQEGVKMRAVDVLVWNPKKTQEPHFHD